MCLRPIPLKRVFNFAATPGARLREYDSEPVYSYVSCGTCSECVGLKQEYLCQRAELMSSTHYVFMQTLTVSNEWLLQVQVGDQMFPAFDVFLFQKYIKRVRKNDLLHSSFKYLACVEYGGHRHRPHMHVLYFVPKDSEYWKKFEQYKSSAVRSVFLKKEASSIFWTLLREWTVNVGSTRNPDYRKLCRFVSRFGRKNYDFHYVEPRLSDSGTSSCVRYVTKYLLKYDDYIKMVQATINSSYDLSSVCRTKWDLLKPRVFISKNFGVSIDFDSLRKVADSLQVTLDSINPREQHYFWYSPETNKKVFMSPYIATKYGDQKLYKEIHLIDGELYQLKAACLRLSLEIHDKMSSFPRYDNDKDLDIYHKDLERRQNVQRRILLKIRDHSNYDFYELE